MSEDNWRTGLGSRSEKEGEGVEVWFGLALCRATLASGDNLRIGEMAPSLRAPGLAPMHGRDMMDLQSDWRCDLSVVGGIHSERITALRCGGNEFLLHNQRRYVSFPYRSLPLTLFLLRSRIRPKSILGTARRESRNTS